MVHVSGSFLQKILRQTSVVYLLRPFRFPTTVWTQFSVLWSVVLRRSPRHLAKRLTKCALQQKPPTGQTVELHSACKAGDLQRVLKCLEQGEDVDVRKCPTSYANFRTLLSMRNTSFSVFLSSPSMENSCKFLSIGG